MSTEEWIDKVGESNLRHVIEAAQAYPDHGCTDPDCELHNIDVAAEECTINKTDLAFWLAGAIWMSWNFNAFHPVANHRSAIEHVQEAVKKFPPRTVHTDLAEDR